MKWTDVQLYNYDSPFYLLFYELEQYDFLKVFGSQDEESDFTYLFIQFRLLLTNSDVVWSTMEVSRFLIFLVSCSSRRRGSGPIILQ